ncbi:sodium:solute symporter family protein [Cardinium endosymbiont of Dermatophagoides farinae]|uniref:sodium:solute symporter family protein n=1 Tax=Cardinium endosymbiont of Dermatophagoides farinae TaxID=2597823 RepID=UPI001CB96F9D|nr:sodium:solute symporter family protein [Cardinium endosymbiont of Dermatophagoides farinae]
MFFCSLNKKVTNFREHAVGHRQFPTAALVATIVASYYPGGLLKASITEASIGLWPISHRITVAFLPLLTLSWLAGRMPKFMYDLSMPGSMARAYGSYARLITALFGFCHSIIMVALQIRLIADTASLFITSVSPLAITLLITLVLVIYAMFGGMRAITFTDVWQSIIFSTLIVVLAWLLLKKTGRPIIETIGFLQTQKKFELNNIMPPGGKVVNILRYLSYMFTATSPYLVQHVYMCSSLAQTRKAFLYAGAFSTVIIICITLVGLFVFVCFPHVPSAAIWNHFLSNTSPVLKGVVCIIILSFAMSTVDSRLHVTSIMLAYDIPKSIHLLKRLVHLYQFRVVRIALLAVALLTVVLACNFPISILVQILLWYDRFYVPVIMAPFILAVIGFRTTAQVALIGMATGLLSVLGWEQWIAPIVGTSSAHIPCMLMNGLAMLIAHHLLTTPQIAQTKKRVGSFKPIQSEHAVKNNTKDNIS